MKLNINGLEVEVKSEEEIQASGCQMMAVPLKLAHQPLEDFYCKGTKSGFPCSLCGQDCILAPSGQRMYAAGKNPLVCMDCMMALNRQEETPA